MSKRRKGTATKRKTVGYGYVGRWNDDALGWCLPAHVTSYDIERPSETFNRNANIDEDRAVLCRITVEQIFDSKQRPITRKPVRPQPSAELQAVK